MTGPIVTPNIEDIPFVDVLVDSVPAGVDRLTVLRQQDGRWMPVRSGVSVRNVGAWTGRDYEAGFDRTLTYRVQYFTEDGTSVGFSDVASTELTGTSPGHVWVHDPLDPAGSMLLMMLDGFGRSLSRPTPGTLSRPLGRSVPVVLPGTRAGLQDVTLDVLTETRDQGRQFVGMVGGYDDDSLSVLCFRAPVATWLPGALFVFVDVVANPLGAGDSVRWSVSGTEVQPPVGSVVAATLTYGDFEAAYSTYAEFESAYASYLDAERDYSVALS
jgi:hypothetical protein